MIPKDIPALILGTCDYVRLHGKGNWVEDGIKVVNWLTLLPCIMQMGSV